MTFSDKQRIGMRDFLSGGFMTLFEGAIRSGKSYSASLAYILLTQRESQRDKKHIIAGRNLPIMRRELIPSLMEQADIAGATSTYKRGDGVLYIDGVEYLVIAGNDERSYERLRSLTAGCALIDEATLVPESFFLECIARCSYDESQILLTCNPRGKRHWLKTGWIDSGKIDNQIRFRLNDNPALGGATKQRYHELFSGAFYNRNIEGLWADADGLVYKTFETIKTLPTMTDYFLGVDYGVASVTAYTLIGLSQRQHIVVDSYHYDGSESPKTDAELVNDLFDFIKGRRVRGVFIDPSASSFITELRRRKKTFYVRSALNEVLPGIKETMNGLSSGALMVYDCKSNEPLLNEFAEYAWDPAATERGDEKPIKKHDHHCDSLRYVYYSLMRNRATRVTRLPDGL